MRTRVDRQIAGIVIAVSRSPAHTLGKANQTSIRLLSGLGVDGDAHCGETVKHRSRVARDPRQPNLRQVHLISVELHDELCKRGFDILPGRMGENITTRGIDLLGLPVGACLGIREAVIEMTGLRNPCSQWNGIQNGLMAATLDQDEQGRLIRKAGIMAVVRLGGEIRPGDTIRVERPPEPHLQLKPV